VSCVWGLPVERTYSSTRKQFGHGFLLSVGHVHVRKREKVDLGFRISLQSKPTSTIACRCSTCMSFSHEYLLHL
jgi:hypothetical protein